MSAAETPVTSTWTVTGMTCGHCEASVREEISEIPGVLEVRADHQTGSVLVASEAALDPAAVAAAVEAAGYHLS